MSVVRRVPLRGSWSLFLRAMVLAGILAQLLAVTGSAGSGPRATQTRVTSCSGLNFHPIDSETKFAYGSTSIYRPFGTGGSGWFLCDPGLPHRAIVTKLQFTIYDHSANGDAEYCALVRHGLQVANAYTLDALASVPTAGLNSVNVNRPSDTTIAFATIDNARYAYQLQCQLPAGGVSLFGATVTYTITATNG